MVTVAKKQTKKNEGDIRLLLSLVFILESIAKGELTGTADTWGARGRGLKFGDGRHWKQHVSEGREFSTC